MTSTDYHDQVAAALRATAVHSSTGYSWFGQPSEPLSRRTRSKLTNKAAHDYLIYALENRLYSDFYCQGGAKPSEWAVPRASTRMSPFVEALSAANLGRGPWESGWAINIVFDGEVTVRRHGLELRAWPDECRTEGSGFLVPGERVAVRLPKELLNVSPGFYMALGDEQLPEEGDTLVRLYWNLVAEGAVPFISEVTKTLNLAALPFRAKILNDPGHYSRCDTAVIYVARSAFAAARDALRNVLPRVAPHMVAATPAFTKPLAAGLGLSEDPGRSSESFGQHRCHLLAQGIVRAYEQGQSTLPDRLRAVAEVFSEEGIDLAAPYLNPGSIDEYHLFG